MIKEEIIKNLVTSFIGGMSALIIPTIIKMIGGKLNKLKNKKLEEKIIEIVKKK
jgi:hypothetical protein